MKRLVLFGSILVMSLAAAPRAALDSGDTPPARGQEPAPPSQAAAPGALVYADFEKIENNRPVSSRGGLIQLFSYQESDVHKSTFKGTAGADPPAPELVRVKPDDPNHAMKFDYALQAPNQWAGVSVEIHGQPDAGGKPVPDDVSGYKVLSLQVYATGIDILRLEALSNTRGKDTAMTYPVMTFRVRPGLNTYRVPLKGFTQPA
ncbi:MAG: hypothetical protein ABIQ52_14005, partial [Vicinamibacterales bacterium]